MGSHRRPLTSWAGWCLALLLVACPSGAGCQVSMCAHASGISLSSLGHYWISTVTESWLSWCDIRQHHLSRSWKRSEFSRNVYIYLFWKRQAFNIYLSYCKGFLLLGTQIHYLYAVIMTVNYFLRTITCDVLCAVQNMVFLLLLYWLFVPCLLGCCVCLQLYTAVCH